MTRGLDANSSGQFPSCESFPEGQECPGWFISPGWLDDWMVGWDNFWRDVIVVTEYGKGGGGGFALGWNFLPVSFAKDCQILASTRYAKKRSGVESL